MAIISKIGRKSWRVRILFAGMYAFLLIGGASMVYPLMLMLSGSTKSAMDTKYFEIFPRFLYDEAWMWAKHTEGLFNESVSFLNMVHDSDEISFEDMAKKGHLESSRELRCPTCGNWFVYHFNKTDSATTDAKVQHEYQVTCPKPECHAVFSIKHGAIPGELDYQMLQEINTKMVLAWQEFIPTWEKELKTREEKGCQNSPNMNKRWLTSFAYAPGYLAADISKTIASGQREFKKFLRTYSREIDPDPEDLKRKKNYSDINTINRILGSDFKSWNSVSVIMSQNMRRRAVPNVSRFGSCLSEFYARQPLGLRYYYSMQGYFKKNYLKPTYNNSLEEYNQINQTDYRSWVEVTLTRRYPQNVSERIQADWEDFVRKNLSLEWIILDQSLAPLYHEMLRLKHGSIENLNNLYGGTKYKNFATIPFPHTAPITGMARSDWESLLRGFQVPGSNKLYQAPAESIELGGVDFAFQDWILAQYGSVENAAVQLDTDWKKLADIRLPQLDVHRKYFQENISALRWEFVTRNYKAVADYMLFHGRGIFNTVVYCGLAILSALLINPLAAYAMSRYQMPSSYKILLFLMSTMAFPAMVTAIPSFLMLRSFGLLNTFAALILPGMANGYSIFLLKGFFDAQPKELYESAQLDGATEWVLFWQITMSLSKPILAVIALGAFTAAYSNFMFAFVTCQDQKMWTMMVWLYQLQQSSGQAVMYASLVIAAIPTFFIFLFCQNIIMRGIVVPSEK
ncbi:MAG: carbohydrate ABC transporter permease [Lentisphaeria bacterium]